MYGCDETKRKKNGELCHQVKMKNEIETKRKEKAEQLKYA